MIQKNSSSFKQKIPSIENPKKEDICYATTNRQEEVKRLVKHVDLMLVVGQRTHLILRDWLM